MPEINCTIPIKLRIAGRIDDECLDRLERQLVPLIGARLALAERTVAARGGGPTAPGEREIAREDFHRESADREHSGYRIPSYQGPGRPANLPVVQSGGRQREAAATQQQEQTALRRIQKLLHTGITDWWVSDDEAREVLRTLQGLAPEALLYVVVELRRTGEWNKFRRNLPRSDIDALDALERTIDPNLGYIMPGDVLAIEISGLRLPAIDYQVEREGLRLPKLPQPVSVVGLLPQAAAQRIAKAYVDAVLFTEPTVTLGVRRRGSSYAGRNQGPFDRPITFKGTARFDPNAPEWRRHAKRLEFYAYVETAAATNAMLRTALDLYDHWINQNESTPEFLARTPADLWEWAQRVASGPEPTSPTQPFYDLARAELAELGRAPPSERASRQATLDRYMAWLDQHLDDPNLGFYDPADVWAQFSLQVARGEVREEIARKREEKARRAAERPIDQAAVNKKLDDVLAMLDKRRDLRLTKTETIDAPSEGVGYLIMPSDAERQARDEIIGGYLRDVYRRVADPKFTETGATEDFDAWLGAHPERRERLDLAQSHPYVEHYALPAEIPAWQTAIDVGISFIPIVGQIVGAGEAILGKDIFWNDLSLTDRAILGASVLLPAAGKLFRGGRSSASALRIAREAGLGQRQAEALVRAAEKVRPGTAGADLLAAARDDVLAGRAVRDPENLRQLNTLMRDMGMTEQATLDALAPAEAQSAGLGADEPLVAEGDPPELGVGGASEGGVGTPAGGEAPPPGGGAPPAAPTPPAAPPPGRLPGTTGTRHLPRQFEMPARNRTGFSSTSEQIGTAEQRAAGDVRVRGERVGKGQVGTKATEVPGGRTGLRDHWQQHGPEFPEYRNARQYEQGAIDFCRDSATKRFYYRFGGRPTIGYYNEATGTFAATSVDGETVYTYFRPANGIRDFLSNLRLRGVPPGVTPRHSAPVRQDR